MDQKDALNKLIKMFPGRTVSTQTDYGKMAMLNSPSWQFMIYIAANDDEDYAIIYSQVSWEECFDELDRSYPKEKINESK